MWQRFTASARKAIFFAQEAAQTGSAAQVSPEHMLLAILRVPNCAAKQMLQDLEISWEDLRNATLKAMPGPESHEGRDMTLSRAAKRVIDLAYDEARILDSNHIGTEHLLLGLVREADGARAEAFAAFGVSLANARAAATIAQGDEQSTKRSISGPTGPVKWSKINDETVWQWLSSASQSIVVGAHQAALRHGDRLVSCEHLLIALLEAESIDMVTILATLQIDCDFTAERVAMHLPLADPVAYGSSEMTQDFKNAIDRAFSEPEIVPMNRPAGPVHLLLGIVGTDNCLAAGVLREQGVDWQLVHEACSWHSGRLSAELPRRLVERLSPHAAEALTAAKDAARRLGDAYVGPEHLLLALLSNPSNTASRALQKLGVDCAAVEMNASSVLASRPRMPEGEKILGPRTKIAINLANDEARRFASKQIGPEHLLMGLLEEGDCAAFLAINNPGATLDGVRAAIRAVQLDRPEDDG